MKIKLTFAKKYTSEYVRDVNYILLQIWHMAIVKRHFRAAWIMLIHVPTLVKSRRMDKKLESISPFVYAMQ